MTTVRMDMHSGSDHETLVTVIQGRGRKPVTQYQYRLTEADLPKFVGLVEIGVTTLPDLKDLKTKDELEAFTKALADSFKIAIESSGRPDRGGGKPASWWTPACYTAHKAYLAARKLDPGLTLEKRNFLTLVRKAKREYWRNMINNASDDRALYKIINWVKSAPDLKAPPLVDNGRVIEDNMEKAEVLRERILGRFSADDDLADDPIETYQDWHGVTYLPWETSVSIEAVEKCVVGVSSTSPGTDRVTVRLLKVCWHIIKDTIHGLYSKCLAFSTLR